MDLTDIPESPHSAFSEPHLAVLAGISVIGAALLSFCIGIAIVIAATRGRANVQIDIRIGRSRRRPP